ncbi:MAG: PRC-barrel domain-containing protein [Cytophagaceae bacterium]
MDVNTVIDQDNLTGQNHSGPNANRPLKVLTASSVIGDKVENGRGEVLGKIKDIMLNVKTGAIEYIVLECKGGFLGIGDKLFAIPFTALRVNPKNHDFVLNIENDFLERAPGFDKKHWPETNGHYADVNSYWGDFMGVNTSAT